MLRNRRPPDGLLHCSSHMTGSLRHAMLDVAGAPKIQSEFASDMTLDIGTYMHDRTARAIVRSGWPFMQEVKMTPWLPEGWAGTADWVFFHPEYKAWVLGDLKTIKGEGVAWINRDGAKTEHMYQTSAYWHALRKMGLPMIEAIGVQYVPKNQVYDRGLIQKTEPVLQEFEPMDEALLHAVMADRWERTSAYLASVEAALNGLGPHMLQREPERFVTEELAPVQERVIKLFPDKKRKQLDVKLVPHWSAPFCPYPVELCDCSTQGQTKIGHWWIDSDSTVKYTPRSGYEDHSPTPLTTRDTKTLERMYGDSDTGADPGEVRGPGEEVPTGAAQDD